MKNAVLRWLQSGDALGTVMVFGAGYLLFVWDGRTGPINDIAVQVMFWLTACLYIARCVAPDPVASVESEHTHTHTYDSEEDGK